MSHTSFDDMFLFLEKCKDFGRVLGIQYNFVAGRGRDRGTCRISGHVLYIVSCHFDILRGRIKKATHDVFCGCSVGYFGILDYKRTHPRLNVVYAIVQISVFVALLLCFRVAL